ncbi:MAG TPA: response regulator [Nitrospira sp.]|nr:response regulator [Nitrospira sp.]
MEGKTMALLVVEDDEEMRNLLCDELSSEGYQIQEARTGEEAIAAAARSKLHLIITDLRMPGGGVKYIDRLRGSASQCPIVVMTAFGDERTRAELMQAGATAYFSKPVRISELKATVRTLIETHRPRG